MRTTDVHGVDRKRGFILLALIIAQISIHGSLEALAQVPDDPAPVVSVDSADQVATEGSVPEDPAQFVFTRTGPVTRPLTVFYSLSGSARNGEDYAKLSGKVVIPAGSQSVDVFVQPIADSLVEGAEPLVITLEPPVCVKIFPPPYDCYTIGEPSAAKAVIFDSPAIPKNQLPKVELLHPVAGARFGTSEEIGVIARGADPDGYITRWEFFSNGKLIAWEDVNFLVKPQPGQTQSFQFGWRQLPLGSLELIVRGIDDQGGVGVSLPVRITVGDPGEVPVVTLVAKDTDAAEQSPLIDSLPNTGLLVVHRTGPTDVDLKVRYELSGTAINGVDYALLSGTVLIPKGASDASLQIVALDDAIPEGDEWMAVQLVEVSCPSIWPPPRECYSVGSPNFARVLIRDDDTFPPKIAIDQPVAGDSFSAPATLLIKGQAGDADGYVAWVELFANGKKIAGIPYSFLVEPKPGQIQTFEFKWTDVAPGTYRLVAVATDNAGVRGESGAVEIEVLAPSSVPAVTLETVDPIAIESQFPANVAVLRLRRSEASNEPLDVWISVSGSARNGVDYAEIPSRIQIPANRCTARIVIDTTSDRVVERPESVLIEVVLPPFANPLPDRYKIGRPSQALAVILDKPRRPGFGARLPDGHHLIALAGDIGVPQQIEASSDLDKWSPYSIAFGSPDGIAIFLSDHPDGKGEFFRSIPLPVGSVPMPTDD
ncbi:MAG: hypothetical protein HY299_20865 [Verrucomicrobia bacterium]|nr:hypothetical protein [Verrucomicrobiota bacterium]